MYEKAVLTVEASTIEGGSHTCANCRRAPRASSTNEHDDGEMIEPVQGSFKRTDKLAPAESDLTMREKDR
jgi:hypothetical protein